MLPFLGTRSAPLDVHAGVLLQLALKQGLAHTPVEHALNPYMVFRDFGLHGVHHLAALIQRLRRRVAIVIDDDLLVGLRQKVQKDRHHGIITVWGHEGDPGAGNFDGVP